MIEIVIWISPTDIEDLGNTFTRLEEGARYLTLEQRRSIKFNVVMGISDEIIDWELSTVDKKECIDYFLSLAPLTTWSSGADLIPSTTVNGCTSMRRLASKSDSDYYLWLDTDIIFDPITLPHMLNAVKAAEFKYDKFVITPEIVKQWDTTWDCLVNERFIDKAVGYQSMNNPHVDTVIQDNVVPTLVPLRNNVNGQPYMKFGGGWFVILSAKFMNAIPFPKGYGHYGYDDTYLMWGASVLNDPTIVQLKMKNIVVCENYYDRKTTFEGHVKFIDRRDEYKKHNESLFNVGLEQLHNKML